jgi:phage gp16-like protein
MALKIKVVCDRCGETAETSVAIQHHCRRLSQADIDKLIELFLDDLNDRSGFALPPSVRAMIRHAWRAIAQQAFKTSPNGSHGSNGD